MREILFFYIMFIVVGNSKVFAEPNTVQGNRELVSAILNKMPESTTNESKIVFGIKEQFYLIVVNDTIGTEYFVTIDTQNKNFELIPVKFIMATVEGRLLNTLPIFNIWTNQIREKLEANFKLGIPHILLL